MLYGSTCQLALIEYVVDVERILQLKPLHTAAERGLLDILSHLGCDTRPRGRIAMNISGGVDAIDIPAAIVQFLINVNFRVLASPVVRGIVQLGIEHRLAGRGLRGFRQLRVVGVFHKVVTPAVAPVEEHSVAVAMIVIFEAAAIVIVAVVIIVIFEAAAIIIKVQVGLGLFFFSRCFFLSIKLRQQFFPSCCITIADFRSSSFEPIAFRRIYRFRC